MSARRLTNPLLLLSIQVSLLLSGCGGPEASPVQSSGTERQPVASDSDHPHDDDDDHGHHDHDHDHHIADHRPHNYADLVRQLERRPTLIHSEANHDMHHAAHELEELRDIIAWLPEIAADTDLGKRDWDDANRIAGELARLVPAQAEAFVNRMKPGSDAVAQYEVRVNQLSQLIPLAVQN
jgi:hypothetical protein